jgi:hypothetical protein
MMSKEAQAAVKKIAKLLGAMGPVFLRTDGEKTEEIIDDTFEVVRERAAMYDGLCK